VAGTGAPPVSPGLAQPRSLPRPTRAERAEAGRRRQRRRSNVRLAVPVVAVVGLLGILAIVNGFGQPDIGESPPSEGGVGVHLPHGDALPQRNRPPSSGPHYPDRAAYGVFSNPVPAGSWLHALEHGAIAVLFRCAEPTECQAIAGRLGGEVYANARNGQFGERKLVITPYQDMDEPIAAVAWDRVLRLQHIDSAQILAFYDRYLDRGPEAAR
jgi:hypothetical protein